MKITEFSVVFEPGCAHTVKVIVHKTVTGLRRLGRYKGENSVRDADAFCWCNNRLSKSGVICEIHLAKDILSVDDISHESVHAAFHRARLLGLLQEERTASDTGFITGQIVAELTRRKIHISA